MSLRFSTGLRNAMLGSTGLKAAMANGVIRIYSGAQPANADSAVQGTLLAEITVDGGAFSHGSPTNGLNFDDPANALLQKAAAETWRGVGLANGSAGWFRFCANPADAGGASTTLARIDGSVAKTGGDLSVSNTNVETSVPITVDVCNIAQDAQ